MPEYIIRLLESPEEMTIVEDLQRIVWPGSETEIVPVHLLITAVHNGGLVLGALIEEQMVGFIFGFPGFESVPDGPLLKHCSHMLGIHPDWRNSGLGFALKRAQWQMVRQQGINHATWTYDPLLSRNAYFNIAKLGAVCNIYHRSEYGEMRDGLNLGLPTDRFQVDWWLNTPRVERRLDKNTRGTLKLDQYTKAGLETLYTPPTRTDGLLQPPGQHSPFNGSILLAEIPSDFMALKAADMSLASDWRFFSRELFETAFEKDYLVTDFVFESSNHATRSLYVLTHGETTLEA